MSQQTENIIATASSLTTGTEYEINDKAKKSSFVVGLLAYLIVFMVFTALFLPFWIIVTEELMQFYNIWLLHADTWVSTEYAELTILDSIYKLYPIDAFQGLIISFVLAILIGSILFSFILLLIKLSGFFLDWWILSTKIWYKQVLTTRFADKKQSDLDINQKLELLGVKLFKSSILFLPISLVFMLFDTISTAYLFLPVYLSNIILLLISTLLMINPKFIIPNIEKEFEKINADADNNDIKEDP